MENSQLQVDELKKIVFVTSTDEETFFKDSIKDSEVNIEKTIYIDQVQKNCSENLGFPVVVASNDRLSISNAVLSLLSSGVKDIFCCFPNGCKSLLPLVKNRRLNSDWIQYYQSQKPVLDYLEYQVVDHCNLNCNICSHFSNLVKDKRFADITEFMASLNLLKEKFFNVHIFRLMGGEPLLNNQLPDFIYAVRDVFPQSEIHVVTNGLLLLQMPDELLKALRQTSSYCDISQYPVISDEKFQKMIDYLDEYGIFYELTRRIDNFRAFMSKGKEDYEEIFYNSCFTHHACKFLRGNSVYACSLMPLLYENKEFFNYNISATELSENTISLESNINGWDILCRLSNPFTMCRFCAPQYSYKPWECGGEVSPEAWLA